MDEEAKHPPHPKAAKKGCRLELQNLKTAESGAKDKRPSKHKKPPQGGEEGLQLRGTTNGGK